MASAQDTAEQTLSMLEERLKRVDFLLHGDALLVHETNDSTNGKPANNNPPNPPTPVSTRLHHLERNLQTLANRSNAVYDVLHLQQQVPDLFHTIDVARAPSTLAPASLAQLVLAHEQLYKQTASQLQAVHEISEIPDSSAFAKLITSQARIEKLAARQAEQSREVADLRARSALLVEKWYESGVLEMGERWADWEERLRDCEIIVRRQEAARRREEGSV